jgi:hypothetical protein
VSFQISGPVVFSWIAGLAGFLNCWGRKYFAGIGRRDLLRLRIAPFMPSAPGVRIQVRAEGLASTRRRSMLIVSGMVRVSL